MLVNRYAAYNNCGTERQSVVDVLIGRMAAFLSMRDVRPLAAAVAEFEVARQTMPREYAALAGHYEDLAVPMVQRLTEVLAKAVREITLPLSRFAVDYAMHGYRCPTKSRNASAHRWRWRMRWHTMSPGAGCRRYGMRWARYCLSTDA